MPESDQPYGAEATETTKSLALDQEVRVIAIDVDRYERMVAEVQLLDGRSLNHELVKTGACWWYRKYALMSYPVLTTGNSSQCVV